MSSSSSMLSSQIETSTSAMAPTTSKPVEMTTSKSSSVRPTRKGRKVKGRRKNKNRNARNSTINANTSSSSPVLSSTTIVESTTDGTKTGAARDAGIANSNNEPTPLNTHHDPPKIRFTAEEAKTASSILNDHRELSPVPRMIAQAGSVDNSQLLSTVGSAFGFTPSTLPITQPMGKKLPIEEFIHITVRFIHFWFCLRFCYK